MELRPYQIDAVEELREKFRGGARKVLLISPTGSGKTVTFCHVIERAVAKGRRALVLAHRRELVAQASSKLEAYGVPHGIIQAGFAAAPQRLVQVASVQTLARRRGPERTDIIVVDEAHHTTAGNTYGELLGRYPEAIVLGVTATPWRLDGRGLADVFPEHVVARTPRELRDEGYLVPVGGWAYEAIDTEGARIQRGDFAAADLKAASTSRRVVGDVVQEWLRHAGGRRTVLFAISVEQSRLMVDAFRAEGVPAEHLDGETPAAERDAILARLRAGQTLVVGNCQVLTEGWDCPEAEVAILARPTLSTSLYLQMVGRVLRPSPGKLAARIHDHAGCLAVHGHPYAARDYSPELACRGDRRKAEKGQSAPPRCPACKSVSSGRWPCDACGWSPTPAELKLEYEAAARRREITNDGTAPQLVGPAQEVLERRKKWMERFAKDEGWQRDFFFRMVDKHGRVGKAIGIFRWFSGESAWPRAAWKAEAEQRLRQQQGAPAA